MTYQIESISYLITDGLLDVSKRQWEELEGAVEPVDIDWDEYKRLEDANILRFMTVRYDGVLVGYATVLLFNDMHRRGQKSAVVQEIYIVPEHRKGFAGIRLIKEVEKVVSGLRVNMLIIASRETFNSQNGGIGVIFDRLGFVKDEVLWTKRMTGSVS